MLTAPGLQRLAAPGTTGTVPLPALPLEALRPLIARKRQDDRLVGAKGPPWQVLSDDAPDKGGDALPAGHQLPLVGIQRLDMPAFGHPRGPHPMPPRCWIPANRRRSGGSFRG